MTNASDVMKNFLYDTTKGLTDIDFWKNVIQFDNDATSIASGEATALYACPPVFKSSYLIDGATVSIMDLCIPIGGVQNYSLNESKQVIPFAELGSRIKRMVMGSTNYSASLSRLLTLHSDLYYSCYSWLPVFMAKGKRGVNLTLDLAQFPGVNGERHFVSMDSEIFSIPFGLLCITGSASGDVVHVEYLERCYIQGGGAARAAGNPMIIDGCSISVTRPVPFLNESGNNALEIETLAKKNPYILKAPNIAAILPATPAATPAAPAATGLA